ncbi:MAG: SLC13 family permease [Chloroflexi bacterium]|nr:SLC13 family permease [Chloroflexota bacterium]
MSGPMLVTLIVLIVAIILFITEKVRLDVVAMMVMAVLMLTGVVTVEEGLAGFSNKAVISIAALFIVGGAVFQTGLAGMIAVRIMRAAGGSAVRLLVILMVAVGFMSAFISSTGVVALMLPAALSLARSQRMSSAKLLIPMAYAALLGGTLTLIGTPPNLLVSEALRSAGYAPFDLFSFTPLALPLLLISVVYMLLVGRRLLPEPKLESTSLPVVTPGELFAIYELPGRLFRLRVQDDSPLVGRTIGDTGIGSRCPLTILSLTRSPNGAYGGVRLLPWSSRETINHPMSDTVLQANDVLQVQSEAHCIAQVSADLKLAVMANEPVVEGDIITNDVGIAEVVLRPRSALLGKTIAEVRFSRLYRLTVLSLHRPDRKESLPVKSTPLEFGDVLLVQGEWKDIFALKALRRDFIVMGESEALAIGAFTQPKKAPIALIVLLAMVLTVAFNIFDLAAASIGAALILILTGCLTIDDAYKEIDLRTICMMAGIIPLSTALAKVGLVDLIAEAVVGAVGASGPMAVQIAFFVTVVIMTQFLSNTATTVLFAPLAVVTAQQLGVQPHALLMTVAIASSLAFATPLGTPVNTLVMNAGRYRFRDYVQVGVPLIVVCMIVTMILLSIVFPY